MAKKHIISTAFLVLLPAAWALSLPVLTYGGGLCTDSDGGDIYSYGSVSVLYVNRAYFYPDLCIDNRSVVEWSCRFDGNPEKSVRLCPAGSVCRRGRCAPSIPRPEHVSGNRTCIDSDNGLNTSKASYAVTYRYGVKEYALTDACSGENAVSEAYCFKAAGGEEAAEYVAIECPEGFYCSGGACIDKTGIKPVTVFSATPSSPPLTVSRNMSYTASAGAYLEIGLKAYVDPSRPLCAYGISEKVPKGWKVDGVSSLGVIGRYPGNGTVRMTGVVEALNAYCAGNSTLAGVLERLSMWQDSGVAPGSVEWIIWDMSGNASSAALSYRVAVPYNASVNSWFYGDYTWDGVRYHRTEGNYGVIAVPATTTTTTTTTTSLPVLRVGGIVYHSAAHLPVPGAGVVVSCSGNPGISEEAYADGCGYYAVDIPCPVGSDVSVQASTEGGDICTGPYKCVQYYAAYGNTSERVLSPGYVRVNVSVGC